MNTLAELLNSSLSSGASTSVAFTGGGGGGGGGAAAAATSALDLRLWLQLLADYLLHPLVLCLLCLVSIFVVMGNLLVVSAIWHESQLHSVTNYLIASLACADCLVGTIVMPFSIISDNIIGSWTFGPIWCDLWHSFDVLASTASIMNLCAISLDRYLAITNPISYPRKMTPKRVALLIATLWTLSSLISFPAIMWWRAVGPGPLQQEPLPYPTNGGELVVESEYGGYAGGVISSPQTTSSPLFSAPSSYSLASLLSPSSSSSSSSLSSSSSSSSSLSTSPSSPLSTSHFESTQLDGNGHGDDNNSNNGSHLLLRLDDTAEISLTRQHRQQQQPKQQPRQPQSDISAPQSQQQTQTPQVVYKCVFTDDTYYLLFSSIVSFYGPLCVMLYAYYRIYVAAVQQTRFLKHGSKQVIITQGDGIGGGNCGDPSSVVGESYDLVLRAHRGGGASHTTTATNSSSGANANAANSANAASAYVNSSPATNGNKINAKLHQQQHHFSPLNQHQHPANQKAAPLTRDKVGRPLNTATSASSSAAVAGFDEDLIGSELSADEETTNLSKGANESASIGGCHSAHLQRNTGVASPLNVSSDQRQLADSADGGRRAETRGTGCNSTIDHDDGAADAAAADADDDTLTVVAAEGALERGQRSAPISSAGSASSGPPRASKCLVAHYLDETNKPVHSIVDLAAISYIDSGEPLASASASVTDQDSSDCQVWASGESVAANLAANAVLSRTNSNVAGGGGGEPPQSALTRPLLSRNDSPKEQVAASPNHQPEKAVAVAVAAAGGANSTATGSRASILRQNRSVYKRVSRLAKERKAAKTLGIVVGVFILCWLPFFVANIIVALYGYKPQLFLSIVTWLGWLNSAMNPVIYACWSRDFRRAFRRVLCAWVEFICPYEQLNLAKKLRLKKNSKHGEQHGGGGAYGTGYGGQQSYSNHSHSNATLRNACSSFRAAAAAAAGGGNNTNNTSNTSNTNNSTNNPNYATTTSSTTRSVSIEGGAANAIAATAAATDSTGRSSCTKRQLAA